MAKYKWSEQKEEYYWKLPAKKIEYNYGNNILRIYSETFRKLRMNQSRELLVNN